MGANPAWQKTLFFESFVPGQVNRASREENYPSGKGVNFCRALKSSAITEFKLFQFAGGNNGQKHCQALDRDGFDHETVITAGETRNCITCLDRNGFMTELIGVSVPVSDGESRDMLDRLKSSLPQAAIFAITGSLPDGSDPDLYPQAVAVALENDIPVLIDSLVKTDAIMKLPGKIILKVNQEEFFKITGENEIISAHRKVAALYPGKIFAITNGPDNASLSDGRSIWSFQLPETEVVNPLGSGDTAAAVMSALTAIGESAPEAFRQALAAASANCQTPIAGEFYPEKAAEIASKIKVSSIAL